MNDGDGDESLKPMCHTSVSPERVMNDGAERRGVTDVWRVFVLRWTRTCHTCVTPIRFMHGGAEDISQSMGFTDV